MQPAALTLLRDEHRLYATLLRGTLRLVHDVAAGRTQTRLEVFRAILEYVKSFPEQLHHPKEDAHLFRLLRLRCPEAAPLLDTLHAEHRRSCELTVALDRTLAACERGTEGFAEFAAGVEAYAAFQAEHLRREEEQALPLALAHLSAADWLQIEAAFRGHTDPLLGAAAEAEFGRLLKRIVLLAPPPLGTGTTPRATLDELRAADTSVDGET